MGALDFLKNSNGASDSVSPLKNPFDTEFITDIHIWISNQESSFSKPVRVRVQFKNGDTEGEQKFQGDNLQTVMIEVQAFIDSLGD